MEKKLWFSLQKNHKYYRILNNQFVIPVDLDNYREGISQIGIKLLILRLIKRFSSEARNKH